VADVVDRAKRSQMMAGIQGKNTQPELSIRKALHAAGIRYRLHVADLPGTPDIVCTKYTAAILVHGCFWHRHRDCWWCTDPSTRQEFWKSKFDQNIRRDTKNVAALRRLGWRVAIVWECALRVQDTHEVAQRISKWLETGGPMLVLPLSEDMRRSRTH
jgi:DNA mismatch endonuclease (patch repair protein)